MDGRRKTYRTQPPANCVEARRHWNHLIRQHGMIYWLAFNDDLGVWMAKLLNGQVVSFKL